MTGPHPTKWHRTGRVIEVRQFDQYVVRVDGSGRVTLRNRKLLRKFFSAAPRSPHSSLPSLSPQNISPAPHVSPAPYATSRENYGDSFNTSNSIPPLLIPQSQSSPNESVRSQKKSSTPRALARLKQFNNDGLKQETDTDLPKLRSMQNKYD